MTLLSGDLHPADDDSIPGPGAVTYLQFAFSPFIQLTFHCHISMYSRLNPARLGLNAELPEILG